jgi:DNA-binding MarR family transcriptional regulator
MKRPGSTKRRWRPGWRSSAWSCGSPEPWKCRDADLNHFEYCVLVGLEHAEGGTMRMSDLAFLCNGSLSRLSHVARRLENEGLIERFACPDDGRSTLARLTGPGRERLAQAAPGHVRLVRELVFDELDGDEMRQMGELAKRVLARIQS